MDVIAILLAALAGFATGAAWYIKFSRPWLRASGIPLDDDGQPVVQAGVTPFAISGVAMLFVSAMMRHMLEASGIESPGASLVAGLGVGAFFIAPWVAMNYAYAMRSPRLLLIDNGYAIVGCGVIGLILGLF